MQKVDPKKAILGTAFYALNPLFLIEGIANGHNDLVFATFLLLPIYFSLERKREILSYLSFAAGALIKYISILNLPWYFAKVYFKKPKGFENFVILNILTMAVFTIIYSTVAIKVPFVASGSTQVQFQPWYLFWTIPFIAFIPNPFYMAMAIILAIGSMLRYLPFIYFGDWSQSGTIQYMQLVTVLPALVALLAVTVLKFKKI